jgi:hypothetical protein
MGSPPGARYADQPPRTQYMPVLHGVHYALSPPLLHSFQSGSGQPRAARRALSVAAWLTLHERVTRFQPESDRIFISQQLERVRRKAEEVWSRERVRSPVRAAIERLLILGVRRDDRLV